MQTSPVSFPADFNVPGQKVGEHAANAKAKAPAVEKPKVERQGPVQTEEVVKLKESLAEHNISLKFSKDTTTNALVVQMIDDKTGEAVQQFPTQVSLSLAANFIKLQGQFVDNQK